MNARPQSKQVKHKADTVATWVAVLVLLAGVSLNGALERNAETNQQQQAQLLAENVGTRLDAFVQERQSALSVMARNWPNSHPNVPLWFAQHAADTMEVLGGVVAIGWYGAGGELQAVQSADWQPFQIFGSLAEAGLPHMNWPQGLESLSVRMQTEEGRHLVAYLIPMLPNRLDRGCLVMVIDPQAIAAKLIAPMIGNEFTLKITSDEMDVLVVGQPGAAHIYASRPLVFKDQRHVSLSIYANHTAYQAKNYVIGFAALAGLLLAWAVRASIIRQRRLNLSQQRFKAASESSLDGLLILAPNEYGELAVAEANPMAERLIGRPLDQLLDANVDSVAAWLQSETLTNDCYQVLTDQQTIERRFSTRCGKQWFKLQLVHTEELVAVTLRDVSQRMIAQQELKAREEKFRRLVEGLNGHVIYAIDSDGQFEYLSDTLSRLLGWSPEKVVPRLERILASCAQHRGSRYQMLLSGQTTEPYRLRIRHQNGNLRTVELSESLVFDNAGELRGIEGIAKDITDADKLQQQVTYQAHHDALTGLFNRYHFDACIAESLEQVREGGVERWLFYFDLDQFKAVNDSCGHIAGDALLRQLTHIIQNALPDDAVLARLGGDEFAVLFPMQGQESAVAHCEELIRAVREFRFGWEGQLFQLGASGGLVEIESSFVSADELLRAADAACYIAKERGRNRIHLHADDEATQDRHRELHWFSRLRRALEQDQFELHMQPICAVGNTPNKGLHYEVLLRLRDEQNSLVSPAVFIPAAERYGVMPDIDLWVVSQTLALLDAHPEHVDELDCCSINLSAATLSQHRVTEQIIERVSDHPELAAKICFEITETSAISLMEDAQQFIGHLKSLGCRFALDDFGAGMTSFAYLKNLPVDYLKIDGQFVRRLAEDKVDQAVVRAFKNVGLSLGMELVAEFVSSDAILEVICDVGIHYGQGYALGKPLPLAQYLQGYQMARAC
ncbi:hypothetical protein GCM10025776_26160 [Corallincola platygyrae]